MRKCLRDARKALGLTQQAVADRVGISLRYYQQIEQGVRTGEVELWDALEELTAIHQKVLRTISRAPEENQS